MLSSKTTITAALLLLLVATLLAAPATLAASHQIKLTAEPLPNGQYAYKAEQDGSGLYPEKATIPGPTLFVKEGETVTVELTNNTDVEVGFQVPGLSANETTKVAPDESRSYTVVASQAGTYPYQDADLGLVGLFGALVVDRADGQVEGFVDSSDGKVRSVNATELAKQYVLFMVGSTFWGMEIGPDGTQIPLWTNPELGAVMDDIVRFHVLSLAHDHTFHLHAHRWPDNGTFPNTRQRRGKTAEPLVIDTKLLAQPADNHVFTVKAGDGVGPGDWQYHCHVFAHMESGMHGNFKVVEQGQPGTSVAGASPYAVPLGPEEGAGVVTFEVTDEPGEWFRSTRGSAVAEITDSGTHSLDVIHPGDSVNFIMSDTNTVHTVTSLLWPKGAETLPAHAHHGPSGAMDMPFDQSTGYDGGGLVTLSTPGLYVFTCKIHPYMFAAVIVDDPETEGFDLGEEITLVNGITVPTTSDLATRLLRTFFIATDPKSWQDYTSSAPWHVAYPDVNVEVGAGEPLNLRAVLDARYGNDLTLEALADPETPGVGEVWVDTQFEKTAGKSKPGTATVVDTRNWTVRRKVSLPEINMNNPHNMWTDKDQKIIYQTQWFDDKLAVFDREDGKLRHNIRVGEAPAHVMTRTDNDDVHVSLNGENGVAEILAGEDKVKRIIATQGYGEDPTHPHAHWMSADGKKMVTPNAFTADSTIYDFPADAIQSQTATGALPIATGMMPDDSKYYVANFLDSTLSVIDLESGALLKTINLLENYDPIEGEISGPIGALPIQTPVSPDGKYMVTANTLSGTITLVDTATDEIVAMLPCSAGCHGAQFGAKYGGGYYAYVVSKFSNELIVVDPDPNGDGNGADAEIVGRVSLAGNTETPIDDPISDLAGFGGQGVLPIPVVYNGWVQNLPEEWKEDLTDAQRDPLGAPNNQ